MSMEIESTEEQEKNREVVNRLLKGSKRRRENLMPILQKVQAQLGYIPNEAMLEISRSLKMSAIDVYSVVTFYNQFRLNPPGKHSIRVCLGTACHIKGGTIILDAWKRRLNIDKGQTTPDREFDLDTVACVGCCAMAPITVVDDEVQGKISPTRIDGIILSYELKKQKEAEAKGER